MKLIVKRPDLSTSVAVQNCKLALDFWTRFSGYMFVKHVSKDEGILFPNCTSIHMWFTRSALDIVFLNKTENKNEWTVRKVVPKVRPWKLLPLADFGAEDVLEIAPGQAENLMIKEGDILCLS